MDEYRFLTVPPEAVRADAKRLADLPESARRVFAAVREAGPVTHTQLQERTGIPARTIRFALRRLRGANVIDARRSLRDGRACYFFVHRDVIETQALTAIRLQAASEAEARDLTLKRA